MKYPDNFSTPTFPAGPRIAVSRVVSVWIMIVFALIVCLAGLIIWTSRSQQVHPFLVTVDDLTGSWQVIGHDHGERTITQTQALQESVIAKFTKNWFTVSLDATENDEMWASLDSRENCQSLSDTAQIFCGAGDDLYNYFITEIVPDYLAQIEAGESWSINVDDIYVKPADDGKTWIVQTDVYSSLSGYIPVIIYITLQRDLESYPQNMGFYVADFNAYKI